MGIALKRPHDVWRPPAWVSRFAVNRIQPHLTGQAGMMVRERLQALSGCSCATVDFDNASPGEMWAFYRAAKAGLSDARNIDEASWHMHGEYPEFLEQFQTLLDQLENDPRIQNRITALQP